MSAKCQLDVAGRSPRTSSAQFEIDASEWPFPNSDSTVDAAPDESLRWAISATTECPSWPQGSACPTSAHVQANAATKVLMLVLNLSATRSELSDAREFRF